MSTGAIKCCEWAGPQQKKYEEVSLKWSINDETFGLPVRIEDVKARPNYGCNPLRWIFRRPKWWDVTYEFTCIAQDTPECQAVEYGAIVTTDLDIVQPHSSGP